MQCLHAFAYMMPLKLTLCHFTLQKNNQNGKQQTRRIAISPDNRAIYITTNRPQGRVLSMLKRTSSDLVHGGETSVPVKEIDLSMVVRMQLGQQSRRFERAR